MKPFESVVVSVLLLNFASEANDLVILPSPSLGSLLMAIRDAMSEGGMSCTCSVLVLGSC